MTNNNNNKASKLWTSFSPWNHKGTTWISSSGTIYNQFQGSVGSVNKKGDGYNSFGNFIGKISKK